MRSCKLPPVLPLVLLAAFLPFAGGCAYYGGNLRAGVSTEAELLRDMGTPAESYERADGGRQLAFPRGPLGVKTFMAHVSRDGRLQAFEQVLNEEHYERIVPGRTRQEEVRRLIGPPAEVMDFPRLNQLSWTYRFQDRWGRTADFSVMFDRAGLVVRTVTVAVEYDIGLP